MRCLKRYVAREVYRQITNPTQAPSVSDLRPLRQELGITLPQAAKALQEWPSTLSRLERSRTRNDELLFRYRNWLHAQPSERINHNPRPIRQQNVGILTGADSKPEPREQNTEQRLLIREGPLNFLLSCLAIQRRRTRRSDCREAA